MHDYVPTIILLALKSNISLDTPYTRWWNSGMIILSFEDFVQLF